MNSPIKESDDNGNKDSPSFCSKDIRDTSFHKLLIAFGIAGTIMAIIILFAYSVSYQRIALGEILDTPSISNEPATPEEKMVEPERLVEQVLVMDDQGSTEILEQEEQPIEVEEILQKVSDISKNTTAVTSTTTLEPISIPVNDNLTATVEDISEEREEDEDEDINKLKPARKKVKKDVNDERFGILKGEPMKLNLDNLRNMFMLNQ